jgi:hypothetical protein
MNTGPEEDGKLENAAVPALSLLARRIYFRTVYMLSLMCAAMANFSDLGNFRSRLYAYSIRSTYFW